MTTNYYDAFVPSLILEKNFSVSLKQTNFSPSKFLLSKKKNLNRNSIIKNQNLISMRGNSNSGEDYITILNEEFISHEKNLKNKLQSLPPTYKKLISLLIFSTSLVSGWYFAPSRKPLICAGFSVVTGGAGLFLSKKFNIKNEFAIKKQIIQNIQFDSKNDNLITELNKIQKENSLTEDQLKSEIFDIYKKFLEVLLRNPVTNLEEIQNLKKIKKILNLSSQDVGQCHYDFAQNLYKDYIVMLEREGVSEPNEIINKFFFLSDRIFSQDSAKGYQYESARIRKIFLFLEKNVKDNCIDKSVKLYKDFIQESLTNSSIQSKDFSEICSTLGLPIASRDQIHGEFYEQKISEILSNEQKISANGKKDLENLQNLLEITPELAQNYLAKKTEPLISLELANIFEKLKVQITEQELTGFLNTLETKTQDFLLSNQSLEKSIKLTLSKVLRDQVENSLKFLRGNKKNESVKEIEKILYLRKNFANLGEKILEKKDFSEVFSNLGNNFKGEDIKKIYVTYLNSCLTEKKISVQNEGNLSELEQLFGMSAKESSEIYKITAGPLLENEIKKVLEKKAFDEENKNKINEIILSLKIEESLSLEIKCSIYQDTLKQILLKESFPTQKEQEELENFRKFLSLRWVDVQEFHDSLSEIPYQKSINEALGATGIIPKNYWEGLENLRKRLRMSEEKAKEIFYRSIKDKLRIGLEKAISDNKKKAQPKGSESGDSGEDPTVTKGAGTALGIEAGNPSGNELVNLVDLYSKNSIFVENEKVFNEVNQVSLLGQTGRAEIKNSTKSKIDYSYPVNLDGLFNKKITTDMYREYLVECFSVKSQNEKRKLFNNLDKLGPILGLNSSEIESIHSSVGSVVYKQYLSQALNKGFLDKSEMAFLSNIQDTLSMSSSKCSEFIREAKKNKVSVLIESIFSTSKVNADRVSDMRKIAKQLGVDLNNDLEISSDQRSKMFRVEIDNAIEKGKITKENQELIGEIQSGFGLPDDLSKKILLQCISSRCESHLVNAVASLRKNSSEDVFQEIEKMLNFGDLLPIQIKNSIGSGKERAELFSIYQTNFNESLTEEQYDKKIKLLKLMLGLN
uniref:Uncharacterized protein n=1 Tax=Hemiselmis andersenii TaxID=464988 RepID=A0A7S0Y213_HEMAN|mmetsp:Transcript_38451/g.89553  ORF Transcript_38451/g.89553 Transcript_38451/m.89553 type:complete len:1085 (+) Transcript_38451:37-3291(+)